MTEFRGVPDGQLPDHLDEQRWRRESEQNYLRWCREESRDPEAVGSAIEYEEAMYERYGE